MCISISPQWFVFLYASQVLEGKTKQLWLASRDQQYVLSVLLWTLTFWGDGKNCHFWISFACSMYLFCLFFPKYERNTTRSWFLLFYLVKSKNVLPQSVNLLRTVSVRSLSCLLLSKTGSLYLDVWGFVKFPKIVQPFTCYHLVGPSHEKPVWGKALC